MKAVVWVVSQITLEPEREVVTPVWLQEWVELFQNEQRKRF